MSNNECEVIKALETIGGYCTSHESCDECILNNSYSGCTLNNIYAEDFEEYAERLKKGKR